MDEQELARRMLAHEAMNMKLNVGRILGIIVGLVVWWTVLGPAFGGDPILTFGSLFLAPAVGMYIGQYTVVALIAR